jgi:hypothetical protein
MSPTTTEISGLNLGQRYYVNLLETSPVPIFALYASYLEAINDHERIQLATQGSGTQYFSQGAVASCVTSAMPVRENNITLKFDRTSYTSQVIPWQPGNFYGSFYAGTLSNSTQIASSSILLYSEQPPISSILASAEGAVFEILDVYNQQSITWSSRTRDTVQAYGSTYTTPAYQNAIRINPSIGGADVAGSIGSTIGFYIGMPIKFVGSTTGTTLVGSSPTSTTIYYVKSLLKLPKIIDAGSFVSGTVYTIVSVGNTNFVAIGASSNSEGVVFTATGTGSGTGTASDDTLLEDTGFTI